MNRLSLVISTTLLIIPVSVTFSAEPALSKVDRPKSQPNRRSRQYPPQLEGAEAVVYKTIGDVKLNVYVFKPEGHTPQDRRPAIVFFFGGGWRGGSPAQFAHQCEYFASRGMVAITADYRVSSRHGTKAIACVADGKSAIRWVREHAEQLGVDPDRIVASGGSAGGHVAACTGVIPGMQEQGEDTSISSQPNAMVLFNPVMALTPVDGEHPLGDRAAGIRDRVGDDPRKISPFDHIAKGQPPTIIFFGTDDHLLKGAQLFEAAANRVGNRCELLTWDGLKHGFFNYGRDKNRPFVETLREADTFLASLGYLEGEPTATLPAVAAE